MMRTTQFVRPLSCLCNTFQQHRSVTSVVAIRPNPPPHKQPKKNHLPYSTPSSPLDFQSRGLRLLQTPLPSELQESSSSSSSDSELQDKKSRNERKREARRAVQWGMDLATFSVPHIKRILSAASLDQEVFDAIMLVKRLGPDVREGKRRQFNYIGRLLREVQPELMDGLIQASKDGDQSKLQELSGAGTYIVEEDVKDGEETECEEEEVGDFTAIAYRWFDGLIDKDSDITNEVYSIHTVEFDRQELRKLVRRVHNIQSQQLTEENKTTTEAALAAAKKPLLGFLRSLAKQMESE